MSSDPDLNAEVIKRMVASGDNMSVARPVDFNHVFSDEASAVSFAAAARSRRLQATIEESGCVPEMPWGVIVTRPMVPEVHAITATERDLESVAESFGGRADGWGCVSMRDS